MKRLGLAEPTIQPKATHHIEHIIDLVKRLVERGIAYEAAGDVYFSVGEFPSYLKLSKRNMDEMRSGARIAPGEHKRNPMDFALWKAAKPGEPSWDSPWGPGRPGWHIECSAMAMQYLGESFDIHGGGKDLVFPHHENEIAQSEGATGKPFVKYWLHNGFVNVNQEKMSKSLGNFFTIRDILNSYDPEVLRFFILTAHYRSPIDFSDQNLQEARLGLSRFYEALQAADEVLAACKQSDAESDAGSALEAAFREAMDDDFNTAAAIGQLFDAVRTINRLITEKGFRKNREKVAEVRELRDALLKLGDVLGLFASEPAAWLKQLNLALLAHSGYTEADMEEFIRHRQEARKNKDFARADEIRDKLAAKGIQLLDGPQGTTWKVR
jgi:cysteinyl-tRNA synthetase